MSDLSLIITLFFDAALPINTNVREITVKKWVLNTTAVAKFSELVNYFGPFSGNCSLDKMVKSFIQK